MVRNQDYFLAVTRDRLSFSGARTAVALFMRWQVLPNPSPRQRDAWLGNWRSLCYVYCNVLIRLQA